MIARFIPGGRTAVTFASGYTQGMPWRRFIVADVIAGLIWGTYAAMLGYVGGKQFEEEPWKGLLLGFVDRDWRSPRRRGGPLGARPEATGLTCRGAVSPA